MHLPLPNADLPADALLGEVAAYLTQAQEVLKSGAVVSLEGLDHVIAKLCRDVNGMSEAAARGHRQSLQQLVTLLDGLKENMTHQQQEIRTALGNVATQRKANIAYSKLGTKKQEG